MGRPASCTVVHLDSSCFHGFISRACVLSLISKQSMCDVRSVMWDKWLCPLNRTSHISYLTSENCNLLGLVVLIVCGTGAFAGNHAGTIGICGTAALSKECTFWRGAYPSKYLATATSWHLLSSGYPEIIMALGCMGKIFVPQPQPAVGDGA